MCFSFTKSPFLIIKKNIDNLLKTHVSYAFRPKIILARKQVLRLTKFVYKNINIYLIGVQIMITIIMIFNCNGPTLP